MAANTLGTIHYKPGTNASTRYGARIASPGGPAPSQTLDTDELGAAGARSADQIAQIMHTGGFTVNRTDPTTGQEIFDKDGRNISDTVAVGPSSMDLLKKNASAPAPVFANPFLGVLGQQTTGLRDGSIDVGKSQADQFADAYARAAGNPLTAVAAPQTTLDSLQGDVNTIRGFANGAPTAATGQFNVGLAQATAQQQSNAASVAGAQGGAALQNANEANIGLAGQGQQALAAQQAAEQLNAQGQLVQGDAALGAAGKALSDAQIAAMNPDQLLAWQKAQADAERNKTQIWSTDQGLKSGTTTATLTAGETALAQKQAQDAMIARRRQAMAEAVLRHLGIATGAPTAIQPMVDKATIANNERTVNTVGADISSAGSTAGVIFGSNGQPQTSGSTAMTPAPHGIDTSDPWA